MEDVVAAAEAIGEMMAKTARVDVVAEANAVMAVKAVVAETVTVVKAVAVVAVEVIDVAMARAAEEDDPELRVVKEAKIA